MATTYRITLLGSGIDNTVSPPPLVSAVFPAFSGEPCVSSKDSILVTFDTPQTPADLGPLVKVETVTA